MMSDESKALTELGKAGQELAKTASKGIDVVQKFGEFVARYASGPFEQVSSMATDSLRYYRLERLLRFEKKINDLMKETGEVSPTKTIPLKMALKLLQSASIEDNDYLQDMWATLLVNSSISRYDIDLHPVYIEILNSVTPLEAAILDKIYYLPLDKHRHHSIVTGQLPKEVFFREDGQEEVILPSEEVSLALANLTRLGCLSRSTTWGGTESLTTVNPTVIGRNLVKACRLRFPT